MLWKDKLNFIDFIPSNSFHIIRYGQKSKVKSTEISFSRNCLICLIFTPETILHTIVILKIDVLVFAFETYNMKADYRFVHTLLYENADIIKIKQE